MLTGAWMKLNSNQFESYLAGMTVEQYVGAEVEPDGRDVEQPSMHALYDCIFKPAGITIDVVYLDRTSGDQAMIYSLEPQSVREGSFTNIRDPVMSLLYHRQ